MLDGRFTVLGPVAVTVEGRELAGMAPRHRAVLAYLLINARTVVGFDRLIDAMWGPTSPDSARAQIHAAVTAVRRVLREAGVEQVIDTRAGGYMISPVAGQLDLDEFNTLVATGDSTDREDAAAQIRAALELWRGEPLADVKADYVFSARARLIDRRLTTVERLAELELALGRNEELVDELSAEVAAHPLREKLVGHLVLALYRAGRQADALAVARTFREALADQQGLDPGRAFATLEAAVLRDDPGLTLDAVSVESRTSRAEPAIRPARRANFLPYDTPDFAGRSTELDRLAGEPGDRAQIAALDGMAGIGKTTLAVHVANRSSDRFPDGQLFVDLQAHTSGQRPVAPSEALETLLLQLGVSAERIPPELVDRAALWRAELTDRRVVVVLDNALDTDHLKHLLPGTSASLFLITSRRRLIGLDGARALSVDVLPAEDSIDLFTRIVGERAHAEPVAVLDVLQLCGFLPLAVRIAAARLHHRPRWTVRYLADRLRQQRGRLSELSTSERSVAAAFTLSYRQLDPLQQRMFRLLGLHPGRDIDAQAAGALAAISTERAEQVLEDLLDAHVLAQHEPARYTFHDLLREHAHSRADEQESPETRHAAKTSLFDSYRYRAAAAIDLLYPYIRHRMPKLAQPDPPDEVPRDQDAAVRWLEAERANLLAVATHCARTEWPSHAGDFATILFHFLDRRAHHSDAMVLHTEALHAARSRGDTAGEGRALIDLSEVHWRQGRPEQAMADARCALELSRATGDRLGEALAHNRLAFGAWRQGDYAQAHDRYTRSLALCREIGDRVGEAAGLDNLGTVFERQGRYAEALDHHRGARDIYREIGSTHGEVDALDNLGLVYRRLGQYEQARTHHRQALELYRELGYRSDEAEALNGLGAVARATGDAAQAVTDHGAALTLAREVGNMPEAACAHDGLAHAHRALGRIDTAREHATHALDLYVELELPEAHEVRVLLSSLPRKGE
ncbi:tetratricopeptide repeat protein [Nocardia sp. GCM10030253]|uniref:AfsR/SARP family transcriptional regulator n=1 Tax=Nocardia sp. GCM10030253 TaxID=3273404 RepID=UPI003643D798